MSKQLQQISVEDVIGWEPCEEYTPERIRELLPEPVPVLAICDMRRFRSVSATDRLWVLLRPEILKYRDLRLFACDCAEQALMRARRAGSEPDERSWDAVAVTRRYAIGKATTDKMNAARKAAWAVVWKNLRPQATRDATRDNFWTAAYSSACAVLDSVGNAAWTARYAASDAAGVVMATERHWQLKRVAHYLRHVEADGE